MSLEDLLGMKGRSRPKFTIEDKLPLYEYQKHKCNGCKRTYELKDLDMDHKKKPFSKGGGEKPSNLQLLCSDCNSTKGTGTQRQLEKRLVTKGVLKAPPKPKNSTKKGTAKKKSQAAKSKKSRKNRDPLANMRSL